MDKSILEEAIVAFKIIVENENIKLIFTCPNCGAEHDLAELIELLVENRLKGIPDLACLHCNFIFDLSETKEFQDVRKEVAKAYFRQIAKIENIYDDELERLINEIVEKK